MTNERILRHCPPAWLAAAPWRDLEGSRPTRGRRRGAQRRADPSGGPWGLTASSLELM